MLRPRLLPLLLAFCLLASEALATWSLVVVNRRTGEVCIASATCIENFDLRSAIGVVATEAGGGATQSFAVAPGTRVRIRNLMQEGVPLQEILDIISVDDPLWTRRQIGLVDMSGRAVSYSGANCGGWFGGVTGEQGDYVYAIQGNVLTGAPVVAECEAAFLAHPGDMGQKVMAAMEAAMAMGGDGRCSCSQFAPESCGSPPNPPGGKSAHVAFFLIARPGEDEVCNIQSCAQGPFYLNLNFANVDRNDPDPVLLMRAEFDVWRAALAGRPDAVRSTVWPPEAAVRAGSGDVVSFVLDLADVDGNAVSQGGATVTLAHDLTSAGRSSLQQVVDHQDGTYTVLVQTGAEPGLDRLRFLVDDGIKEVTLWPPVRLLHEAPGGAPTGAAAAVPGLDGFVDLVSAHLTPDGLTAWVVADRGAGRELLTAARPGPGAPFGPAEAVALTDFPSHLLTDFWASADGLRAVFTAYDRPLGASRVWTAARADLQSAFGAPVLQSELDSGLGEQGLAMSANELEIVFSSKRDGDWNLMRARRLTKTARFFAPEKLEALATPDAELGPVFEAGDTRLLFSRVPAAGDAWLHDSLRGAGDSFTAARLVPGVAPADGAQPQAVDADGALWIVEPGPPARRLARLPRPAGTLSVNPDALSLAQGGSLSFALDAGAAFAGAPYRMLAGLEGAQVLDPGTVLPFLRLPSLEAVLRDPANAPGLQGSAGVLDASGRATAHWRLPPGFLSAPGLIGRSIHVAFAAQAGGVPFVSSPQAVRVDP